LSEQLLFINQLCIAITLLRTTYFEKPNPKNSQRPIRIYTPFAGGEAVVAETQVITRFTDL
jgi:hypothetical protein